MRGALAVTTDYARAAQAVRRRHRIVPGGPAPAGRCPRRHRGLPQHCAPRRLGGRRAAGARRAGRGLGGQGLLRPGRPFGLRDGHSGARRHRQHLGVPGARLPAPRPPVERRARWRRAQPGPRAGRPRHRSGRWTSLTRPRSWSSDCACASGCSRNNPGLPASSTADEYWAGQAAWHQALYDAGFFGLSWPTEVGGHGLPSVYEVILDEELINAGDAAASERRLPGAGDPAPRQRGHPASIPAGSGERPGALVPRLQRTRRRIRPGVAAHAGRAGRFGVRAHRPQGVDELFGRRRLVPRPGPDRPGRPQAPRHLRLHRPDAPARH